MSILKDRVKLIAGENDTFVSGTALKDTEILMNGYYHYTVKTNSGATIPLVRSDVPNVKLDSITNAVEVQLKKINDVYTLVSQATVAPETIYGNTEYYGRGGNGTLTDAYWDQVRDAIAEREAYTIAELEKARQNLQFQVTEIVDPAGPVRTQISADIEQVRANLAGSINGLQGELEDLSDPANEVRLAITNQITATKNAIEATDSVLGNRITTLNTNLGNAIADLESNLDAIEDPGSSLRQEITSEIAANKQAIEAANGVLGTRINSADSEISAAKQRIDAAESAITTINDPAGLIRQEIVSKIAAAKSQIEAQGSVLDARFDADIAAVDSKVTTINNVTIPNINTNITTTVNQAKSDMTTLMDSKDGTLKSTIESTTGTLANLMDTKNTSLKNTIEATGGVLTTRINTERDALIARYGTETFNLVSNGNANGGSVLGWNAQPTAVLATAAEVPTGAPSQYVFKMPNTKLTMNAARAITGGTTLKFSYWVTTTTTTGNADFGLTVAMLKKDGSMAYTGLGGNNTPASALNTWKKVEGTYVLPTDVVQIQLYMEYKATLGNYAAAPWYFTNVEVRNITDLAPVQAKADQLFTDVYTTTSGIKDKLNSTISDLTANGINSTSNINGRMNVIESDLNTATTGIKAKITNIETTKANSADLSAAATRITSLETGVTSAKKLYEGTFIRGLETWSAAVGGETLPVINNPNVTIVDVPNIGKVMQAVSDRDIYSIGMVPINPTRKYRLTIRYRFTSIDAGLADNTLIFYPLVASLDNTFTNIAPVPAGGTYTYPFSRTKGQIAVNTWYEESGVTITGTAASATADKFRPGVAYARLGFLVRGASANNIVQVQYIKFEDVTDLHASNSRIDSLEYTVNTPTTGLASKVSALETTINTPTTGLTARIGTVETTKADVTALTAQADRITTLNSRLGGDTGNLVANSVATSRIGWPSVITVAGDSNAPTTDVFYTTARDNMYGYVPDTLGYNPIPVVTGEQFYMSAWVKTDVNHGTRIAMGMMLKDKPMSNILGWFIAPGAERQTSDATGTWKKIEGVFTSGHTGYAFPWIQLDYMNNDRGWYFTRVEVRSLNQNKVIDARVGTLEQTVVDNNSAAASRLNTLESSINTGPNNLTSLRSGISTLESTKADGSALSASNSRISTLETDVNTRLVNLVDNSKFASGSLGWLNSTDGTGTLSAGITFSEGLLKTSTMQWVFGPLIPVDTARTYKGRFKVRVVTDGTDTNKQYVFAGVATYDKDKVLQIANPGTHRYFTVSNYKLFASEGWKTFEGTITGEGTSTHAQFRPGTKYIRPMFLVNYSGGNAVMEVAEMAFEDITDAAALTARVSTVETSKADLSALTASNSRITTLENDLNTATTGVKARLTTAENTIVSNNSSAVGRLNTLEASVNTGSNSLTNLRSSITSVESSKANASDLTASNTRITTLENDLNSASGANIKARLTSAEGTIVSNNNAAASRLNSLETVVRTKDNLVINANNEQSENFFSVSYDNQVSRLLASDASVPAGAPTTYVLRTNARDTVANRGQWIDVMPGDTFYASVYVANKSGTTFDANLMFHTVDKTETTHNFTTVAYRTASNAVGTWSKLEGTYTVPAGHVKLQIFLQQDRVATNTDAANSWYFTGMELRNTNAAKESRGKITTLETVVGNASSGLVQKVNSLDTSINTPSTGLAARLGTVETGKVDNATFSAAAGRISTLETTVNNGLIQLADNSTFAADGLGYIDFNSNPVSSNAGITFSQGVLKTSSTQWVYGPMIPVDTSRTYRVRLKIKTITDGGTTANQAVYAGVATYDSAKVLQTANPGSHRYCASAGTVILASQGLRTFEGNITGEGNTTHNQFRAGTKYVRPMFIVNYSGGTSSVEVSEIAFEDVTDLVASNAKITSLEQTVSTGAGNLVSKTASLEAALTSGTGITNYAKLNTIQSVAVDAQGKANATYGVQLDVNGRASGWTNVNNGTSGIFSITADKFYVYNPSVGDTPVFAMGTVNGVNKLALRGDMIVDGSITASKITTGNGVNMIPNGDFTADLSYPLNFSDPNAFWRGYFYGGASMGLRSDWSIPGKRSLFITESEATPVTADSPTVFSRPIPITPGKYYSFSALLNKHRAPGKLLLFWTDRTDSPSVAYYSGVVSSTTSIILKNVTYPAPSPVNSISFDYEMVSGLAPANATYVRLAIQKGARTSGADSYLFMTNLMLESSDSPITEPSPYSTGGVTVIDGGMIQTGYLSANRIAADSITATHIASNAITVNELAANSVSTDKLQANSITAGKILAGEITTNHMNAGSINADRLTARTITADRIVSGSITTNEIKANAITANLIAAGAITTDKLAIGGGKNLLDNSEFPGRLLTNWYGQVVTNASGTPPNSVVTATEFTAVQMGDEFSVYCEGGYGMYVRSTRTDVSRIEVLSARMTIQPSVNYILSANISAHRCSHTATILWYDSNDVYINEIASPQVAGQGESLNYIGVPRVFKFGAAPANARFARVMFRGFVSGSSNYYLFVSKPMFEQVAINQAHPSLYSPSGSTLIDAGKIVTGYIGANVVDAAMIRSKVIDAVNINAEDIIASNSITAAQVNTSNVRLSMFNGDGKLIETDIRPGEIRTNLIATDAIISRHIQTDTIETRMLKAGAITTDKLAVGSGINMLFNPSFRYGLRGWNVGGAGGENITTRSDYTIPGVPALELRPADNTTNVTGRYADSNAIDIVPSDYYYISAYVSSHRITAQLTIMFFDSTNTMVAAHGIRGPVPNTGGNTPAHQTRVNRLVQAPNNATKLVIRLESAQFGDANATLQSPYMWWSRIMVERSQAGATSPSTFSESGSTVIDGGAIQTGYIGANVIDAEMIRSKVISATKINAVDIIATGSIKAAQIDTNAVTADKILAGAIKTDKIESLAIEGKHIATDAIEARMVKAGAISADKLAVGGTNLVNNSTLEHPISTSDNFNGYDWAFFNYNYTNVVMDAYSSFVDREAMLMLLEGDGLHYRPNSTQQTADVSTVFSTRIQVAPGKWYNYSYLTHVEACNSSSTLRFTSESDDGSIYHGGSIVASYNPTTYDYQSYQIKRDGTSTAPLTLERRFISVQAPPNAKYIRILLSKGPRLSGTYSVARFTNVMLSQSDVQLTIPPAWSRSGSTLIDGGMIKTGFINADRIQANSIKASHIDTTNLKVSMFNPATGKIDTTNITPGAITTSLIDANAVTANNIAAGAITVDKLSVGKGVNLLTNGDFSNGFNNGWTWNTGSTALTGYPGVVSGGVMIATKDNDPDFTFGTTTLKMILANAISDAQVYVDSPKVSVQAGKYYMAQGRIGQHRVTTRVEIDFHDSNNNLLQRDIVQVPTEIAGSRIDTYNLWFKRVLAPANASYMKLRTVNNTTTQSMPVIWMTNYMIEECSATTTEPSAYSSGGSVLIEGGMIKANSINANSIIASTLQVTDANIVGQITASKLAIVAADGKVPGTLINGSGITTLGNVQAGSFNLGNGKFIVTSDGTLNATGATFSGTVNATALTGTKAILTTYVQADRYVAKPNNSTTLTDTQAMSGDYDLIRYMSGSVISQAQSSTWLYDNTPFLTVSFPVIQSTKPQFLTGSITFNATFFADSYRVALVSVVDDNTGSTLDQSTHIVAGSSVTTQVRVPFNVTVPANRSDYRLRLSLVGYNGNGNSVYYQGYVGSQALRFAF